MFYTGMINTNFNGPLKNRNKNIPDTFIYKSIRLDDEKQPYRHYTAFNKNGKIIGTIDGEMHTIHPSVGSPFFPGLKSFKSFYVYYLESHQHNFGSKLLDFVQNVSRENGGGGRFHLIATSDFNPQKPAHIFYRKYGMDSLYDLTIKNIDRCIKGEIPVSKLELELEDIPMYYIPKKINKQPASKSGLSLIKRFIKLFK